jgi:hypothetical protein
MEVNDSVTHLIFSGKAVFPLSESSSRKSQACKFAPTTVQKQHFLFDAKHVLIFI